MSEIREPLPELLAFFEAYPEEMRRRALALRAFVLTLAPQSYEYIYDAYSAVSMGFSLTVRPLDAFCDVAIFSRHVNLVFRHAVTLDDPHRLLRGTDRSRRHVRIEADEDIDKPELRALVVAAMIRAAKPLVTDEPEPPFSKVQAAYTRKRRPTT